jgi:hypothetical protein
MPDTKQTSARQSFAQLKTELGTIFIPQSDFEMIHDEDPPGIHRIKVRFDANADDPRLLVR